MVMVPRREPRLMQLSLVPLSPGRALAVLVGEAYVDPLEWWDARWVQTHIYSRLQEPRR